MTTSKAGVHSPTRPNLQSGMLDLQSGKGVAVAAIADLYFDGSATSWQDFMDALLDIKSASDLGGVFARVRPPERCAAEARRVIRDLGLDDCVELLDPEPRGNPMANVLAQWAQDRPHPQHPRRGWFGLKPFGFKSSGLKS